MQTLLAPIVQVCDAISGARPGARREIVEAYIKRLNDLEQLALSYPGVVKTYATKRVESCASSLALIRLTIRTPRTCPLRSLRRFRMR